MFSPSEVEESLRNLKVIKTGPEKGFFVLRSDNEIKICPLGDGAERSWQNIDFAGLKALSTSLYVALSAKKNVSAAIICPSLSCQEAALKEQSIPPILDDMAQIIGGSAEVGSEDNPQRLKRILRKQNVCPIKGKINGLLAIGNTPLLASAAALVMDKSAEVYLRGQLFGKCHSLEKKDVFIMHLIYRLKYSKKQRTAYRQTAADFPQGIPEEEIRLRNEILSLGRRLEETNLIQGTWGNISLRLNDDYMLTTPSGLNYASLTIFDIVKVNIFSLKYEGKTKPTSEKTLHAGIYRIHKEASCVIHAHPVNCSLFASLYSQIPGFPQKTFLAPYGLPTTKKLADNVLQGLNDCSCALMENHGIIVYSSTTEEAFKKCQAMEQAALKAIEEKKGASENG